MSYPFLNLNGEGVEVSERIRDFIHSLKWLWLFFHAGIKAIPF